MNNHITAFNNKDIDTMINDMSEEIQLHLMKEDLHLTGRDKVLNKYQSDFDEDPEAKIGIRQLLVDQDKAVLVEQFIDSADDDKIDTRLISVAKISEGKIQELWKFK